MNPTQNEPSVWEAGLDALLEQRLSAPLPEDIDARVRLLALDTLGCAIAGLRAPAPAALAARWAGIEAGEMRLPMPDSAGHSTGTAAALLATAACWDEACEGLAVAHGRPGVAVVSALLPLAVRRGLSMQTTCRAIATGYEVAARLGAAMRIRPGMHVDAGWPALGVAAGVIALQGGDAASARAAIEIAAAQLPFGLYLPVAQGADARNIYLGHAAWLGLHAAHSAMAGIAPPQGAVSVHAGLALGLDAMTPLVAAERWLLAEGYLKAWPAVRHVHYGIAAALALRPQLSGGAASIRRLRLRIYPEATVYCGNRAPGTPIQAQFSLAFGLAAALAHGELTPETYREPRFDDPDLRRLERLAEIEAWPAFGDAGARIAQLDIETVDGQTLSRQVDQVAGDPGQPFDRASTRAKFIDYAAPTLGPQAGPLADAWLDAAPDAPLSTWWMRLCTRS